MTAPLPHALAQTGGIPPLPPEIGSVMIFNEIVLPLLGMAMGGFVLWGAYRIVTRLLERHRLGAGEAELDGVRSGLEQLKAQSGLVEDLTLRLNEVEERLDFAERLLTREREQTRLKPGEG
ncbi:MAG: hypothetical protein OEO20_04895 [Gemmatimonadota bacterium]|nr:hypothetical protein [Gemmatimonadota bacterium]MDH3366363.1 hypothetical protein [Gemmatimonadota bacterium]MDH3477621.1 hypothetical protein [Gemmatimonadota bacterium]MDH5550000.1 hypothetical protein [Gemmatimonadota bacterium]